jgi:hypothetical protein
MTTAEMSERHVAVVGASRVSGLKRPDSSRTEAPDSPSGAGIADAWIRRSSRWAVGLGPSRSTRQT